MPLLLCLLVCLSGVRLLAAPAVPPLPDTPKKPVTDVYQRVSVTDDYRWLEQGSAPEVHRWSEAQNAHTRAVLDALPSRPGLHRELEQILKSDSPDYQALTWRHGMLFALKIQPPKQHPLLVMLSSATRPFREKVIVDPDLLDPSGTTAIDFFAPSLDGKYVAVSLSENGSEDGTLSVFETATGLRLPDRVPHANYPTGGGSITWDAAGHGFFYTRYPASGERAEADLHFYQQVWFHPLGAPATQDTYALGKDFPRIAETELQTSDDGRLILATVANGDGGEFAHYVRVSGGMWQQITQFSDQCQAAVLGKDDALYLLSRHDAPRGQILRLPLADKGPTPRVTAQTPALVPMGADAILGFVATPQRLYVNYSTGGPSELRVFDHNGKKLATVPSASVSSIGQVEAIDGDSVLFRSESYLDPPSWYQYDPAGGKSTKTGLVVASPVSFADCEVSRVFAVSKDGTKIPLNIIHRKGAAPTGNDAALLNGYGGYGIPIVPAFNPALRPWIDAGGIFAVANLRGGGEYGEAWHHAGNLTHKQTVFDDFAACAQYLIENHYTQPNRLAIIGRSNGGLLMGASLTQHPELFRAVVSSVGLYDMLRVENDPNGAFNVTEFGTVKDPAQFPSLYAYSPYAHVKDGTLYPAILMLTGENDGRVNPYHSRKMIARLQAANKSDHPILLRTSASAGHGIGSSLDELIDEQTDIDAFLFQELGMPFVPAHLSSAPMPAPASK